MVVASYLISSTDIKIKNGRNVRFMGIPNVSKNPGRLTPSKLRDRCELVFQMIPERIKNLVLVNSDLLDFEMIQECVKVADKYAENVMVIPSLLAVLTYALESLAQFQNPPADEIILVIIITNKFADFVILRRNGNSLLSIAECVHFEPNQCEEEFTKFYDQWFPHATIFVLPDTLKYVAEKIRYQMEPENCFIKTFQRWNYVLSFGGALRASDEDDSFDTRYHIPNFSSGYDTMIQNIRDKTEQRHILLPQRSSLPCNIYGFIGIFRAAKIYYFKEYYQAGREFVLTKREATKRTLKVSGASREIIGYVDERGIPHASSPPSTSNEVGSSSSSIMVNQQNEDIFKENFFDTVLFRGISASINDRPKIKFLFKEQFYGVKIYQNGATKLLTNSFGNEWTPLYLSTAENTVATGEKAKSHYEKFSKFVIFDIFKVIGKPLNAIIIDPKWGFRLIEIDGIVYFQIETLAGARRFGQEMVIATFMKVMKLQAESALNGNQLKENSISTCFGLTESQKVIFEKAATKNNLKILSFHTSA